MLDLTFQFANCLFILKDRTAIDSHGMSLRLRSCVRCGLIRFSIFSNQPYLKFNYIYAKVQKRQVEPG